MNGKVALGQAIVVDWARPDQYLKKIGSTVSQTWDASTVSATLQGGARYAVELHIQWNLSLYNEHHESVLYIEVSFTHWENNKCPRGVFIEV